MKDNQSVKPIINIAENSIIFEVRNHTPLRLDMTKVHKDNVLRAAFVGMAQQRIVDAAAVSVSDSKGNIRNAAERDELKYNRMKALIEHYESGSELWSPRVAAVPKVDESQLIREALIRCNVAQSKVEAMDKEALMKLAGAKAVIEMMLKIKSERIVARVGADEALEELLTRPEG